MVQGLWTEVCNRAGRCMPPSDGLRRQCRLPRGPVSRPVDRPCPWMILTAFQCVHLLLVPSHTTDTSHETRVVRAGTGKSASSRVPPAASALASKMAWSATSLYTLRMNVRRVRGCFPPRQSCRYDRKLLETARLLAVPAAVRREQGGAGIVERANWPSSPSASKPSRTRLLAMRTS